MARWGVYSKVIAELAQLRYHRDISVTVDGTWTADLLRHRDTQKIGYTNFRSFFSYFWLVPLVIYREK